MKVIVYQLKAEHDHSDGPSIVEKVLDRVQSITQYPPGVQPQDPTIDGISYPRVIRLKVWP